jgi:hypothetical protein
MAPFFKLSAAAALAVTALVVAQPASAKVARCVIKARVGQQSGPCTFTAHRGGSFTIEPVRRRYLIGKFMSINVDVDRRGIWNVRAVSGRGYTARWGRAVRSKGDRACWTGQDFSVCAY